MQFTEGSFYHIYNRGNNKQKVFFSEANYIFFLQKVRKYIYPNCTILAWTLLPNHFHFLIQANENSTKLVKHNPVPINALTEGIRLLLSSYTKAIQKQESITGNLFQQKTKSKCVDEYTTTVFHYIHQNAFRAKLSYKIEDWKYSSFPEYLKANSAIPVSEPLCNHAIAFNLLDIETSTLLKDSYSVIRDDVLKKIF
jgi:putative transposase